MTRRRLAAALLALLAGGARAEWTATDADPLAVARVEAPAEGGGPHALLEIACFRGTSENAYALRAELPVRRAATTLPVDATRFRLRLGRDCPGPIAGPAAPAVPGPVTLRIGPESVATRASLRPIFLLAETPSETRRDGPCEIVDRAVDPRDARLEIEGGGETATRFAVELLAAEHRGEIVVEAPEAGARQPFPVAGAAAALARIRRLCGWWEPFGPAME